MWYTPENRFRFLIVRRASDAAVVATVVLDAEKFESADALEAALGRETVRLFNENGPNLEVFEPALAKVRIDTSQAVDDGHGKDIGPPPNVIGPAGNLNPPPPPAEAPPAKENK